MLRRCGVSQVFIYLNLEKRVWGERGHMRPRQRIALLDVAGERRRQGRGAATAVFILINPSRTNTSTNRPLLEAQIRPKPPARLGPCLEFRMEATLLSPQTVYDVHPNRRSYPNRATLSLRETVSSTFLLSVKACCPYGCPLQRRTPRRNHPKLSAHRRRLDHVRTRAFKGPLAGSEGGGGAH